MGYTTSTQVSKQLQRSLTAEEEAQLILIIPAIKMWIDRKTDSTFDSVSATTRYYEGDGSSVDIDPCTEVTKISSVNDELVSEYDFVLNSDYVLEPVNQTVKTEIVRRYGKYSQGLTRVAVTAKFSEYDDGVPEDIQFVATRLASSIIKGSGYDSSSGGLKRESLEGHSVEYSTSSDSINTIADNDPIISSILNQRRQVLLG